jgi:hypothetical protein
LGAKKNIQPKKRKNSVRNRKHLWFSCTSNRTSLGFKVFSSSLPPHFP